MEFYTGAAALPLLALIRHESNSLGFVVATIVMVTIVVAAAVMVVVGLALCVPVLACAACMLGPYVCNGAQSEKASEFCPRF